MTGKTERLRGRFHEAEWPIWAMVIIALLLGLLVESIDLNRSRTVQAGNAQVSYPADWSRTREEGTLFAATDISRGGGFGPRVSMREVPKDQLLGAGTKVGAGATLFDAATGWSITRSSQLSAFRVLDTQSLRVNGRDAQAVDYAYASGSTEGSAGGAPVIIRARDVMVDGGQNYEILTFAANSADYARLSGKQFPLFRDLQGRITDSWRIK